MKEKLKIFFKEKPHVATIILFGLAGLALSKSPDSKIAATGAVMMLVAAIALPAYTIYKSKSN